MITPEQKKYRKYDHSGTLPYTPNNCTIANILCDNEFAIS